MLQASSVSLLPYRSFICSYWDVWVTCFINVIYDFCCTTLFPYHMFVSLRMKGAIWGAGFVAPSWLLMFTTRLNVFFLAQYLVTCIFFMGYYFSFLYFLVFYVRLLVIPKVSSTFPHNTLDFIDISMPLLLYIIPYYLRL